MAPLLILLEPVVLTLYLDSFLTTTLLFKNSEQVFLFIPIMPTTFHDCSHIPDSVLKVLYWLPHLILKLGVSKLSIKVQIITHLGFSSSVSATQLCHYSIKTTIDNK